MNHDSLSRASTARLAPMPDDSHANPWVDACEGPLRSRPPGSRLLPARLLALLSGLLAVAASAGAVTPAQVCHAASGAQRGALVELYTSEGCSSCPPADRWFAALAHAANPDNLSLLAFHVDYWDSIGWVDRFGAGAFSARQRDRVLAATGGHTVYTPQVMLGERVGFHWSSSADVVAGLRAVVSQPGALSFDIDAKRAGDGFDVALKAMPHGAPSLPSGSLYLALYENDLSTQVKAGENDGVLLRHERVVRRLLGPYPLAGAQWARDLHMAPPRDARIDHLGLTAFAQSAKGDTLQALSLPLDACAR
ncbi:MAG TPA: DUF1223 domain-containing protein [Xanthomonadaceae bacterium]|jgi:hypothetical protein